MIDLTCGIGGDLVAFARAGLTTAGIDLDPLRVEMARANLAALGLGGAVSVADATTLDVSPFGTAYADPARRSGRGRSFRADDWTPPWTFVESLLTGRACVKVAPGIPHSLVPDGAEAEWVSDHGEVKEAALWSPRLATAVRRATVIGRGGLATLTDEDDPGAGVGEVGAFLYEPDGAVIRAGLVTAVAAGVGGHLLDRRIAYVTSDESFRTPFARGYRVVERLPFRERYLKTALRERGIGALTIKKRGVDVVARAAAVAAGAARRRRGDARAHPRRRRGRRPARAAVLRLEAEPGEHRQHPAVVVGRGREVELGEDVVGVLRDRLLGDDELGGDRGVRAPLGHQREHLALARRSAARPAAGAPSRPPPPRGRAPCRRPPPGVGRRRTHGRRRPAP